MSKRRPGCIIRRCKNRAQTVWFHHNGICLSLNNYAFQSTLFKLSLGDSLVTFCRKRQFCAPTSSFSKILPPSMRSTRGGFIFCNRGPSRRSQSLMLLKSQEEDKKFPTNLEAQKWSSDGQKEALKGPQKQAVAQWAKAKLIQDSCHRYTFGHDFEVYDMLHIEWGVTNAARRCCHAMSSGMAHFALKCNKTNYATTWISVGPLERVGLFMRSMRCMRGGFVFRSIKISQPGCWPSPSIPLTASNKQPGWNYVKRSVWAIFFQSWLNLIHHVLEE